MPDRVYFFGPEAGKPETRNFDDQVGHKKSDAKTEMQQGVPVLERRVVQQHHTYYQRKVVQVGTHTEGVLLVDKKDGAVNAECKKKEGEAGLVKAAHNESRYMHQQKDGAWNQANINVGEKIRGVAGNQEEGDNKVQKVDSPDLPSCMGRVAFLDTQVQHRIKKPLQNS